MDSSPLNRLPQDTFDQIFIHIPLGDIFNYRCVCKAFNASLSSPAFLRLFGAHQPPLSRRWIFLPFPPRFRHIAQHWFRLPLSFRSHHPITSSHGLLYPGPRRPSSCVTLSSAITRSCLSLIPPWLAQSTHCAHCAQQQLADNLHRLDLRHQRCGIYVAISVEGVHVNNQGFAVDRAMDSPGKA